MILCRTAQHGRPANINILNGVLQSDIRFSHGFLKRIKIYHHQIDRLNAVLSAGGFVLRIAAQVQQSAVHFRMQRLHTAIHHLRKAGVIADIHHLQTRFAHHTRGTAGAEDFHAGRRQCLCKRYKAGLVRYRDECPLNFRHETRQVWRHAPYRSTGNHWQVIPSISLIICCPV